MRRFGLYLALFFLSGAAALVYQVVWMRALALTFSITVHAVTAVLCAFMAGLGMGAMLAGRVADRLQSPLRAFGFLEIGIGLLGVVGPLVLLNLPPVYLFLSDLLAAGTGNVHLARFLLAFFVLMLPTTLMGATLPLLSRAFTTSTGVAGQRIGLLYSINTLGAVLGCALAGFWLIPALGLTGASCAAAAVNVSVGITAIALGRGVVGASEVPATTAAASPPWSRGALLAVFAFAVSGFTAMGYEVLWTRALEQFTHNSTYAYTAMLTVFLLGIGGGSATTAWMADRSRSPIRTLAYLHAGIAAAVFAGLILYRQYPVIIPPLVDWSGGLSSWPRAVALMFVSSAAVLFPMTFLFGAAFPYVSRAVVESLDTTGRRIGGAYAANTVGGIFGAIIIAFAILPTLGVRGSFLTLMALNLSVAFVLLFFVASRAAVVALGVATVVGVVAIPVVLPAQFLREIFAGRYGEVLFYREQTTDTVLVTQDPDGGRWIRYADGRGTAGTATVVEDRMYAQVAMLLHPEPTEVLNICFGVGNSLSSVVQHPIDRVDCVELSPGVVDAAKYFLDTNRNVLEDPRVNLTIEDGRNYLLRSESTYDVIRLDPPELHTAGVVNLYTREFFQLARDHLKPGGIFSIWLAVAATPEPDVKAIVQTALDVFPHLTIWHGPYIYSWVINGSVEDRSPDMARLEAAFADPTLRAEMESIGIESAPEFLNHFVMSTEVAREYAQGAPVITDDQTRLDFTVPRSKDALFGISNQNTGFWLADQIHGTPHYALSIIAPSMRYCRVKQPVLPEVGNLTEAGWTEQGLAAALRDQVGSLPSGCVGDAQTIGIDPQG